MTLILDTLAHRLESGNGLALGKGVLCIAGVTPYYSPSQGRLIWRLRSPKMLEQTQHLYANTVILDGHPNRLSDQYPRESIVGAVTSSAWDNESNQIVGNLLLHDENTVRGNQYFSHGIIATCEASPGTWNGIPYDETIYIESVNHIASTASPRQGDRVKLLFDSELGGEYSVDSGSLKIALPSARTVTPVLRIVLPPSPVAPPTQAQTLTEVIAEPPTLQTEDPESTEPGYLNAASDKVDPPLVDQESLAMGENDFVRIQGYINDALAPLTETIEALVLAITPKDPPEDLADPLAPDNSILLDALAIQAEAMRAGVICDSLGDQATWGPILESIERAAGLGSDWDPSALSIQQRLSVCKSITSRVVQRSYQIQDSTDKPAPLAPVPIQLFDIKKVQPTAMRII